MMQAANEGRMRTCARKHAFHLIGDHPHQVIDAHSPGSLPPTCPFGRLCSTSAFGPAAGGGVEGLGFTIEGSGFRILGLGFRVHDLGFRV